MPPRLRVKDAQCVTLVCPVTPRIPRTEVSRGVTERQAPKSSRRRNSLPPMSFVPEPPSGTTTSSEMSSNSLFVALFHSFAPMM